MGASTAVPFAPSALGLPGGSFTFHPALNRDQALSWFEAWSRRLDAEVRRRKYGLVGGHGFCDGSVMRRVLSERDIEALRERARQQMRRARWILDHCAEIRVRLDRQAAELAALGAAWRRPQRSW